MNLLAPGLAKLNVAYSKLVMIKTKGWTFLNWILIHNFCLQCVVKGVNVMKMDFVSL